MTGSSGVVRRDPMLGTEVGGRFLVLELIGQGGMGKVYKARHLALDKIVCLKTLKPTLLDDPTVVGRFEREAKAASRLNHPNVISVLDFGRVGEDGALYLAMEFVQGLDLRVILRDHWPIPEVRLVHLVQQVLAALGEAHAQNVLHRDLKPENIMVEQRRGAPDFVKVLDFGIAKILDSDTPGLTRSDVVCGTPQYMAPEQATGGKLDARCDLYAVGIILYQLTTGELPFDGKNSMEVLTRQVNEEPIPPRVRAPTAPISPAMERVILKALQKAPEDRPQSALEFRDLLLAVPEEAARQAAAESGSLPLITGATIVDEEPSAGAEAARRLSPQRLDRVDGPPPGSASRPPLTGPRGPPRISSGASRLRPAPGKAPAGANGEQAPPLPGGPSRRTLAALAAGGVALLAAAGLVGYLWRTNAAISLDRSVRGVPSSATATAAATPGTPPPPGPQPAPGPTGAVAPTGGAAPRPKSPAVALPARDPSRARLLVQQARQLQVDGDTGAARDLIEQALQLDGDDAEAHFRLARLLHMTQPARARSEYERALALDPARYAEQARLAIGSLQ